VAAWAARLPPFATEQIEAAKAEWRERRAKLPDGDTESFTPCPPDDGRPLWRLNRPKT
jgi:hypothetical protein